MSKRFFGPNHYKKPFVMFMKNLKKIFLRQAVLRSLIKNFIFGPYGFDYLGFLTNAGRGAMRSKTQWVFYRDLN